MLVLGNSALHFSSEERREQPWQTRIPYWSSAISPLPIATPRSTVKPEPMASTIHAAEHTLSGFQPVASPAYKHVSGVAFQGEPSSHVQQQVSRQQGQLLLSTTPAVGNGWAG